MSHRHDADARVSARDDLDARIEQSRSLILGSLDGLSDGEAREILIAGRPSILGVVRHTAYVEGVWFGEAITGRPRAELGLPVATANSWKARKTDTIESVRAHCLEIREHARSNLADLDLDDVVTGRHPRTVLSLYTHVLDELAWNTGQLDILRSLADSR